MGGRLESKVAFITGIGSSGPGWGTGKAMAVMFAKEGARIFGIDIDEAAAAETRSIISQAGGECTTFVADVTSSEDVGQAVKACVAAYGRVDILVNNIGVGLVGGLLEQTEEEWDRTFDVNLKSVFLTSRHCVPVMIEAGGGSIINISSIAAIRWMGIPTIAYAGSKAAMTQVTRQIAMQYAAQRIRANSILVGTIQTPMMIKALTKTYGEDVPRMLSLRDRVCPGGKMGDAHDIAYAAVYLASDESRFVSGIDLLIDGGLSCQVQVGSAARGVE
jgi:NAD(P)-dependent dehydrogenase (short-subunit alcohol dehydrogenase family)